MLNDQEQIEPKPYPVIRGVISDLDGVVYRGDQAIGDAIRRFAQWREAGVPYCFVTNNAEKSAVQFADKLQSLGVAVTAENIVTSVDALLQYLLGRYPHGGHAYVIGSASLRREVEAAGFGWDETVADCVIIGLDREFSYAKMRTAARLVLNGAELIGTNPDVLRPCEDGYEPGAGALIAAVASAVRKQPVILGKPNPALLEVALRRLGTLASETIMIGDQLATDIDAARRAGIFSVLVHTGVPIDIGSSIKPDLAVHSLSELL